MGNFYAKQNEWLFHDKLGWLYLKPNANGGFGAGTLTTKLGGGQDLMFSHMPIWQMIQKKRDGSILILMRVFESLNFHLKNGDPMNLFNKVCRISYTFGGKSFTFCS